MNLKRQETIMKIPKFFFYLIIFFISISASAFAGNGSCDCKRFNLPDEGKVDYTWTVKVNRDNAPLYLSPTAVSPLAYVKFNENFNIVESSGDRLRVQRHEDSEPMGWIKRSHLLCALKPVRSKTGLDKKFYIKTATKIRSNKPSTVKAYNSPDTDECGSQGCRELARFEGYFVFDESNGRYLLADVYKLKPENRLLGWVDSEDGFIWDTAYGLRPRENFVFPEGHPKAGQEMVAYAYLSKEEAKNRRNGRPILGGDRWFKYALRIPVIGREDNMYKIIMPLAGVGINKSDTSGRMVIYDDSHQSSEKAIENILNFKNIDVFFLIDGTRSIEPYLASIKKVVNNLQKEIRKNKSLGVINSRFGFGIYRDKYAEETELGYWYSLPDNCMPDPGTMKQNHREFTDELDIIMQAMESYKIKGDKDFEENVFGGILKVVDNEISNCPDRLKILFVIGDHGYSVENQEKFYGREGIGINTIVQALRGNIKNGVMPVITFFIQTPYIADKTNKLTENDCKAAYEKFRSQSNEILENLKKYASNMEPHRYFLRSNDKQLTEKVIKGLTSFINPVAISAINEIILDLRGGASLAETIERWQNYDEFNNLPGLFWDLIASAGCKYLGKQCFNRIMDTILEGYIPVSKNIVADIWCTAEDLRKYRNVMEGVESSSELQKGKLIRKELVYALISTLRRLVPNPPPPETGETLFQYVQRISHLPVRQDSPLFKYSIEDLEDPLKVPDCEIERLNTWISNVNQFLYYIADNKKPGFETRQQPGSCPGGADIPYIVPGTIKGKHFRGNNMSYSHPLGGTTIYWIPKYYLP